MNSKSKIELKYPILGIIIFIASAILSFYGSNRLYELSEKTFLEGIHNDIIEFAIKMGLFFAYLVPLVIGALLIKLKNSFFQILGMLFIGLGCGIVFKIALYFVGVINPYSF